MGSPEKNPDGVPQNELQGKQGEDGRTSLAQQMNDTDMRIAQNQVGTNALVTPEKHSQDSNTGVHISQLDQKGSISSITPREVPGTPGRGSHALQADHVGRNPFTREKVSEDGYNWRKYGQKLVKGNEFIRSYYRCTHPGCQVKKQLEHSQDGKITDIVHIGQHDHPKAQHNVPMAVGFVMSVVDGKTEVSSLTGIKGKTADTEYQTPPPKKSTNTSQISTITSTEDFKSVLSESKRIRNDADNNEDPPLKRQKKGNHNTDHKPVDKQNVESRLVVQTESAVDSVNDGYRWRKYGQKMVKGNANPRSYYRCSSPGCAAKKQVERASHDPKLVLTTYEGQHDHDMPSSRTITPIANAPNGSNNGGSCSKSGRSDVVSLNKVGNKNSDLNGISQKQQKCEPKSKTERKNISKIDWVVHSSSVEECKSTEHQNVKSSATDESDAAGIDNKTLNISRKARSGDTYSKAGTESKGKNGVCKSHPTNQGSENKPPEQYTPKAEPVKS